MTIFIDTMEQCILVKMLVLLGYLASLTSAFDFPPDFRYPDHGHAGLGYDVRDDYGALGTVHAHKM